MNPSGTYFHAWSSSHPDAAFVTPHSHLLDLACVPNRLNSSCSSTHCSSSSIEVCLLHIHERERHLGICSTYSSIERVPFPFCWLLGRSEPIGGALGHSGSLWGALGRSGLSGPLWAARGRCGRSAAFGALLWACFGFVFDNVGRQKKSAAQNPYGNMSFSLCGNAVFGPSKGVGPK